MCAIRPRWGPTIEDNLVHDDHPKLNCSELMLCLECSLLWQEILAGLTKIVTDFNNGWYTDQGRFLVLFRKRCKNRASTCPFLFSFSFSFPLSFSRFSFLSSFSLCLIARQKAGGKGNAINRLKPTYSNSWKPHKYQDKLNRLQLSVANWIFYLHVGPFFCRGIFVPNFK